MSKLAKAFLVVVLLWVIVVGAGYLAWGQFLSFIPRFVQINERAESSETITQSATGLTKLSVDTKNGSVIVTATDSPEVLIKAFYSASGHSVANAQERLQQLRTEVSTSGSVLNVTAIYPSMAISNQSIRYEISLPKDLDLKVTTSNGRIEVDNIEKRVELHSSNGTIDVRAQAGPEELLVKTSNGRINVSAAPIGGLYDLRTSNGSVTVTLPESVGVEIKASTSNGSINLGYGQWVFEGGQVSNKNIAAKLGDGSLNLNISTSNGNIGLQKK